ncbi:unnamed protein product [Ixodes pacificus]
MPFHISQQRTPAQSATIFFSFSLTSTLYCGLELTCRVVHVSSALGMLKVIPGQELKEKFRNPDITLEELCDLMNQFVQDSKDGANVDKGWGSSAYNVSKVGVTVLTFIQQRDFNGDSREDLVVNAVHPGYVTTDMSSHRGLLTPDQGKTYSSYHYAPDAPTYLALLPPNIESPKGEFVWNDRKVTPWDEE